MSDCADECRRCLFEPPGARQMPRAVNQTPDPAANRRNSPPLQLAGRTDAGLPAQEQPDVAGSRLDQHALADILVTAHPHATHSVTTACPRARIQIGRSRERPWDGSRKRPLLRACRTWRRPVGSIAVSDTGSPPARIARSSRKPWAIPWQMNPRAAWYSTNHDSRGRPGSSIRRRPARAFVRRAFTRSRCEPSSRRVRLAPAGALRLASGIGGTTRAMTATPAAFRTRCIASFFVVSPSASLGGPPWVSPSRRGRRVLQGSGRIGRRSIPGCAGCLCTSSARPSRQRSIGAHPLASLCVTACSLTVSAVPGFAALAARLPGSAASAVLRVPAVARPAPAGLDPLRTGPSVSRRSVPALPVFRSSIGRSPPAQGGA